MTRTVFFAPPRDKGTYDDGEIDAAKRYFHVVISRIELVASDLVIARHAWWPWPRELSVDLSAIGAKSINGLRGYNYAADILSWAADLGDLTPRTWDRFEMLPERGPFILKAEHADKGNWARMYAETRRDAIDLRSELARDSGNRSQTIVARQYVPLASLGSAPIAGTCPPSVEYRVFVAFGEVLSSAPYWPREDCDPDLYANMPAPPAEFLKEAMQRIDDAIDFYTLDVALAADGRWIVIEVSDGLRAGLSENDPDVVYRELARVIAARESVRVT